MPELTLDLPSESATVQLATNLARACPGGAVIFLRGNLGAGKTTFARGFLRALGVTGRVTSPTFTIVEPYEAGGRSAFHLDLYRINDPDELAAIGIREYFTPGAWVLVEWPERGQGVLPAPDLELQFEYRDAGRRVICRSMTESGKRATEEIQQ